MNQQQFVPEPQGENTPDSQENIEIYQRPYKSAKARSGTMPKTEHPSTFEETIPPHSYRAQDRVAKNAADPAHTAHFHETNPQARQERRRRFSPDGDALENGYQPYQQQQRMYSQSTFRMRPQRQRNSHILRWLILVILAFLLIKPLLFLIGGLFLAGLTVIGIIVLIPLIILGVLILTGFVFAILGILLGRVVWRNVWRW